MKLDFNPLGTRHKKTIRLFQLLLVGLLTLSLAPAFPPDRNVLAAPRSLAARQGITPLEVPASSLRFEPNVGQFDPAVRFKVDALGGTVFLTANEVVLALPVAPPSPTPSQPEEAARPSLITRLRFEGANPATQLVGIEQQPMTLNYFIGNDPAGWHTNIPTFMGVVYQQLYPGIDLRYDTIDGQMKGTYIVAPGIRPEQIRWRYDGPT